MNINFFKTPIISVFGRLRGKVMSCRLTQVISIETLQKKNIQDQVTLMGLGSICCGHQKYLSLKKIFVVSRIIIANKRTKFVLKSLCCVIFVLHFLLKMLLHLFIYLCACVWAQVTPPTKVTSSGSLFSLPTVWVLGLNTSLILSLLGHLSGPLNFNFPLFLQNSTVGTKGPRTLFL